MSLSILIVFQYRQPMFLEAFVFVFSPFISRLSADFQAFVVSQKKDCFWDPGHSLSVNGHTKRITENSAFFWYHFRHNWAQKVKNL